MKKILAILALVSTTLTAGAVSANGIYATAENHDGYAEITCNFNALPYRFVDDPAKDYWFRYILSSNDAQSLREYFQRKGTITWFQADRYCYVAYRQAMHNIYNGYWHLQNAYSFPDYEDNTIKIDGFQMGLR